MGALSFAVSRLLRLYAGVRYFLQSGLLLTAQRPDMPRLSRPNKRHY